ncbi:class I SAM-dependent methyltransferase [Roseicyclus mahoneyensis]|uniref:Ubiquinone/menaquinone biosynthesis C-methylase UbiE n=1 Tax=Roseicyclus mahoneyensis TaxID=164332 RepID=A0A316GPM7_9RHOB|nr:class I SAM-dependent methyltransferase [Roseicyclus mahoneyensis]PWK62844.1 ubiquinone/menaquinone biosynthesis C-methylase UbiE [Roseicyclus mahoneyensis]
MSRVTDQYEAFPYPERDPGDEGKRLITGSPSHPLEIDHFLFGGSRDWSQPLRALVAGGGTGDALIQLAQVLTSSGKPHDITYVDLSTAARKIAQARAKARGLTGIRFVTGSLLDAPAMGPFDYIDCCGVLHHLPDPQAGFDALAAALVPEGGMGLMVYAPFGRSGVYPLQKAFGTVLEGTPRDRLRRAKAIFERIPDGHPFKRNAQLGDHKASDAGFYDLLLHSQDRPFRIGDLLDVLDRAGLAMTGSPQAHLYDPLPILGDKGLLAGMDAAARMDLAEALRGTIRTHVLYAAPKAGAEGRVAQPGPQAVPHLKGVSGGPLAQHVMKHGVIPVTHEGERFEIPVPAMVARALAQIDGRRNLDEIAKGMRTDWLAFAPIWSGVSRAMTGHGLLYYSRLLRG